MTKANKKALFSLILISVFVLVSSLLASSAEEVAQQDNPLQTLKSIRFSDYDSKTTTSNTQSQNILLESFKLKDFSYINQPLELKNSQAKKTKNKFLSRELGPLSLALNIDPFRMRRTGMSFNLDLLKSRDWLQGQEKTKLPNIAEVLEYEIKQLKSVPSQINKLRKQVVEELNTDHRR